MDPKIFAKKCLFGIERLPVTLILNEEPDKDRPVTTPEMCNRPRLVIDLVIDYDFFQSKRNRNRSFLQNSNRNRNRNPVKKIAFDDYNHRKV